MKTGRLIAVVGPSGVGKDSLMAGLSAAWPAVHVVRRVVTRAPGLGGEDYKAASAEEFDRLVAEGAFAVHWGAHELRYGVPSDVLRRLEAGADCLANFSRDALTEANRVFPKLLVLSVTAAPEALARRLNARGRETEAQIERRLAKADKPLPAGLDVVTVSNDGPLSETVARAAALLQLESA